MTVRFFLYSASKSDLIAALNKAGYTLDNFRKYALDPQRIDATEETSNPWVLIDGNGKRLSGSKVPGYGLSLRADADQLLEFMQNLDKAGVGHVIDVEISVATFHATPSWQHWCPGGGTFGRRSRAERLINAEELGGRDGDGVNVFIVDRGLSRRYVEHTLKGAFGFLTPNPPLPGQGAFDDPYVKQPSEHGNLMARNVLALAPKAKIFDVPLIPTRINNVTGFSLNAAYVFDALDYAIDTSMLQRAVIVNAWGIFDRFDEAIRGYYTERASNLLNLKIRSLADRYDVIFAAGNSGQFCPDTRSGAYDRGPGNSIWGANALPEVLSVGATRTDGLWIGTSSQGPGPARLVKDLPGSYEKPDLCAPSWFREDDDEQLVNSGTSAACGIAAGVVAALREEFDPAVVSPDQMRKSLRNGARKFWHTDWNGRMGEGVINVAGASKELRMLVVSSARPQTPNVPTPNLPTPPVKNPA